MEPNTQLFVFCPSFGGETRLKCGPIRTGSHPWDAKLHCYGQFRRSRQERRSPGCLLGIPSGAAATLPTPLPGVGLPWLTAWARRLEAEGGRGPTGDGAEPVARRLWGRAGPSPVCRARRWIGLSPSDQSPPAGTGNASQPVNVIPDPYSKDRRRRGRRTGTCPSGGPKFSTRRSNL